MTTKFSTRQVKPEGEGEAVHVNEREYFFPKENPPRTVKAQSLEEAEEKLKEFNQPE